MAVVSDVYDYDCWLKYHRIPDSKAFQEYGGFRQIAVLGEGLIVQSIRDELRAGIGGLMGHEPSIASSEEPGVSLVVGLGIGTESLELQDEGYVIQSVESDGERRIVVSAVDNLGLLYGVFAFLRLLQTKTDLSNLHIVDNPANQLRMINHWDNLDGSIERGYAGKSIFYENNLLTSNLERVRDYARLLASIGINSIAINNVNVHKVETQLIAGKLDMVTRLATVFRQYGIQVFLSANYASPMELAGLDTADPLDERVRTWWKEKAEEIYEEIPDFGGFLVKADSENRPGPFTYGRTHADGANMLAEALLPHGGIVIWRCFVYNCQQDWRDYKTDRARAAYDHFKPLDGEFLDNVILQIKNGPMDFQVREPVSPLFGGLEKTNQILELQITQEYTGQQRHLCWLVPQWKEVLDFDTYARGQGSTVKRIVDGSVFPQKHCGFAAVVNVGNDPNWTGHTLAQANLFGYGRLAWDPDLLAEEIIGEWIRATFGTDEEVYNALSEMMLKSWEIYENYTSPLGIGWMVNPNHHYGPNVDGYEYSKWGTYHRADHQAIGVDRTVANGTGYVGQYFPENAQKYESLEECPEELLLFFHRVPYTYKLQSGKTLIQHIYDTHFEGVEQVDDLIAKWKSLQAKMDSGTYEHVLARLQEQLEHAKEWRDVVNSYFHRKTGIADEKRRLIY